jgi:hypothetical protein
MFEEVMIQEFRSIIGVEAEEGEGQRCFDVFDLFEDGGFSFSPDCSLLTPARGNVDAVKGIGKHSG